MFGRMWLETATCALAAYATDPTKGEHLTR